MGTSHMTRRSFVRLAGLGALSLAGCAPASHNDGKRKIVMVANVGGINDQGFCELTWAGMQELGKTGDYNVSYIESKLESDYFTNLDKAIDYGANYVWAVGFAMADATYLTSRINPDLDVKFGLIDAGTNGSPNLTGVLFAAEEPSFIVGYIAGRTTQTNKVGFVGGIASDNIYSFEYGYMAGVAYAGKELGKAIEVDRQYAESFTDPAKGKSIAQKMYASNNDIIYHAAGGVGIGIIEAAAELGKLVIGVDMDQSYLAPNNVLTSSLKRVDRAIVDLTPALMSGELEGGTDIVLRLSDGDYMGIPQNHELMPDGVYEDALAVMEKIKSEEIVVPAREADYETFVMSLE